MGSYWYSWWLSATRAQMSLKMALIYALVLSSSCRSIPLSACLSSPLLCSCSPDARRLPLPGKKKKRLWTDDGVNGGHHVVNNFCFLIKEHWNVKAISSCEAGSPWLRCCLFLQCRPSSWEHTLQNTIKRHFTWNRTLSLAPRAILQAFRECGAWCEVILSSDGISTMSSLRCNKDTACCYCTCVSRAVKPIRRGNEESSAFSSISQHSLWHYKHWQTDLAPLDRHPAECWQ